MLYKNVDGWLLGMKKHHCDKKELLPADDPSNDIMEAASQGRRPKKHPTAGYVCTGCEKMFTINLKDAKRGKSTLYAVALECLKSGAGRIILGKSLSK